MRGVDVVRRVEYRLLRPSTPAGSLENTLTEQNFVLTPAQGMDLLEAVSQPPREGKRTTTQWSCVYNQTRGTVDIAVGMDYDNLYTYAIAG